MMRSRKPNSERGATLVMTALMLVVLLGFAALAIDLGVLYTARTSAQHAADAAALAGAFEFVNPCNSVTPPAGCAGWDVSTAATQAAITVAAQNQILGRTVAITAGNVTVDTAAQRVTVNVTRTALPRFFSGILAVPDTVINTTAVAEAGTSGAGTPGGTASHCLKPVFLPNTILSTTELPATACTNGHVIFSSANTVSSWAMDRFNTEYTIRPTNPRDAPAPGQFYSLDFGNGIAGGGAAMYRCTLGNCLNACGVSDVLSCGNNQSIQSLDVETGNMVGPTTDGVNNLIGNPPEDNWTSYTGRMPNATSRNLAVASVWDNCTQNLRPGTNNNIRVIGFVEVFFDSVVQSGSTRGDVTAHVIGPIACAEVDDGGAGTPGPTTGPYTVPIRLIQGAR